MRRLRVSILGMIAVIVALALAFAALRVASDRWFSAVYTFTTFILLTAVIAARYGDASARAFWFGFAVFGWGFYFLEMGPWTSPFVHSGIGGFLNVKVNPTAPRQMSGLNRHLISSDLVYFLVPYLRRDTDDVEAINKITANTIGIAHLLITLAMALVGGLVAALIRRYRGRAGSSRAGKVVVSAIILTGLALGIASSSRAFSRPSSVPFFPPEVVLDEEEGISESDVDWYSEHLAAMDEPALWRIARRDRNATAYRLLWIPSLEHPVGVRIDETTKGAALRAVVLDGGGGLELGQIAIDKRLTLDDDQLRNLDRLLEATSFWDMPTKEVVPSDFGDFVGMSDGDHLIVEGIKEGRYHVVDRWEPDPNYAVLCRSILDLSGLKVGKVWDQYH